MTDVWKVMMATWVGAGLLMVLGNLGVIPFWVGPVALVVALGAETWTFTQRDGGDGDD